MNIPVSMPKVGLTIEEAEVVEWYGSAGASVSAGEPLLVVNADKADVVIDAPASGVLVQISADVGTVIRIGEQLGVIDDGIAAAVVSRETEAPEPLTSSTEEHTHDDSSIAEATAFDTGAANEHSEGDTDAALRTSPTRRLRISPYARRLCRERGIDGASLVGSGPSGRVVARDVPNATQGESRPHRAPLERTSATLTAVADAVELLGVMTTAARLGIAAEPLHVVAWATSQALQSHPFANTFVDNDGAAVAALSANLRIVDSTDRHHDVGDAAALHFVDLVEGFDSPRRRTHAVPSATIVDLSANQVVAVGQPVEPPSTLLVTVGALEDRTRLSQGRLVTRAAVSISLSYLPDLLSARMASKVLYSIATNVATAGELLNSLPHRPR